MVGLVIDSFDAVRVIGTGAVPFDFARMSQYFAVDKDAFPSNPALAAGCANHSACQDKPSSLDAPSYWMRCIFHVKYQAQYQAFVHFAVGSGAALKSHRAQLDLRSGTFQSGRALALRPLAFTRDIPQGYLRGQQTLDRRCDRNVVAPA